MSSGPMNRQQPQEAVLHLLRRLDGLEPLKQLFWTELNYHRVNEPLSREGWPRAATEGLADDPVLFAEYQGLQVFYGRLHSSGRLHVVDERAVINRLLREHPYALFVFSDADQRQWHFVNVKYAPETEGKPEKRRLFRRITVGPYERLRTAAERLDMLNPESLPQGSLFGLSALDLQQRHDEAFDVERVTEEFFAGYTQVFGALQDDVKAQTNDPVWAHDYALQFLNRVMFLYFLQRKRWLGDNTEFLAAYWDAYRSSGRSRDTFVAEWLSPLFFQAFNNQWVPRPYLPDDLNRTLQLAPYLNGGLFARTALDERHTARITDALFVQAFGFFEGYNFTIAEDSPLDQEVAVDPEMIGKVYESLVNVHDEDDESGQWGIFYTPRTEIDLMCRLALVDNLANHLGEEHKPLLYEAVFALEKQEKEDADARLSAADLWPDVDRRLREVTVLDPACGSGSFLVGMLHILADLRERANHALGTQPEDPQYRYELKKEIVGQSLYGVDVKEWAVRVAELRLWLQLVVDAELELSLRKTRPLLPNLSFKIRPGDSLVQEVGGLDLSHVHGRQGLPAALRGRLTALQGQKFRHFRNERGAGSWTKEQIDQEELRIFRDILGHRSHALTQEAKRLEQQLAHPGEQPGLGMEGTPKREKATQLELRVAEWRQRLEQVRSELAEAETARDALRGVEHPPFVWDIAFVEIFESEHDGFDIVVGNPPYVRQERIAPPTASGERHTSTLQERRAYKAKLMRSVYTLYPRFFAYSATRGTAARKLDAKNDLYAYFYFHGLSLLNPRGSFCFITSNSWLDVGYGRDLQEFLLRHSHAKLILDNQVRRSFSRADINTAIALLAAPDDRREDGPGRTARFVMCTVPFEQMLSPVPFLEIGEAAARTSLPEFRVHPKLQRDLLEEGMAGATDQDSRPRYQSVKWGGKYLRAPDVYWEIVGRGGEQMTRLDGIARVRRGFTTGANDFFFVRLIGTRAGIATVEAGDGSTHEIEVQCVQRPVLVKTKEVIRPTPRRADISHRLVLLPTDLARLPKARQYVSWGETPPRRYHKRPTCASRTRWYHLEERPRPDLVMPIGHKRRCVVGIAPDAQVSDNLVQITLSDAHQLHEVAASAYGTFAVIFWEAMGRANFGQGLLKTQTYEIGMLPVLAQGGAAAGLADAVDRVRSRPALMLYDDVRQADRIALDDAFLRAVGFEDADARAEVLRELHDAACRMIWNRMAKTDSARESRMSYDEWLATGGPFGDVPDEMDDGGDEEDDE